MHLGTDLNPILVQFGGPFWFLFGCKKVLKKGLLDFLILIKFPKRYESLHTTKHYVLQFFTDRLSADLCPFRLFKPSLMKNTFKVQNVEPEKLIAERINGWAAMLGFWAAIGAYLTTGQIIPGFV